jgi:hypothetical protein
MSMSEAPARRLYTLFGELIEDVLETVEEMFCVVDPPTNAVAAAELSRRFNRKVTVEDVTSLRYIADIGQYPQNRPTRQEREDAYLLARSLAYTVRHNLEGMHDRVTDKEMRALMLKTERKFFVALLNLLVQNRRGEWRTYIQGMHDLYGHGVSWDWPHLSDR